MRLGIVPFMNLKPLIGRYERMADPPVQLVARPPSQLYPLLAQGEVDAGFIASVDYLRNPDGLVLVPQFGVAARGSVASVLLLCRRPLEEVEEILVDERSSTSVAMLRVLLHHKFRLRIPLVPGNVTGIPEAEALLVIGDRALQCFDGYERVYDIGEEWTSWTGLPFIFGLWVTRDKQYVEPVAQLLEAGWRWTSEHWDEIIETEAERTGLSHALVKVYLQEHIRYELDEHYYEGLARFAQLLEEVEEAAVGQSGK